MPSKDLTRLASEILQLEAERFEVSDYAETVVPHRSADRYRGTHVRLSHGRRTQLDVPAWLVPSGAS